MLSCKGMVPTCPTFDVPSFFGRDIQTFMNFAESWYGRSVTFQRNEHLPWRIIYPIDYLPVGNNDQMRVLDSFVEDLATYLDVVTERISISAQWEATAPVRERNLKTYMQNVGAKVVPKPLN